jgi:hypothetical protein
MLREKAFHNWHTDVLEYLSSGVWRVFSHRVFNATNFIYKGSGCTRAFVSGGSLATKVLKTAYVTQKFPPSKTQPHLVSSAVFGLLNSTAHLQIVIYNGEKTYVSSTPNTETPKSISIISNAPRIS